MLQRCKPFNVTIFMSQSATLYRVSKDTFKHLKESAGQQQFEISSAKDYALFQGSFMGLEYVLSKGQDDSTIELVNKIFTPNQSFGVEDFDSLTSDEKFEFYENLVFYLDSDTISKLCIFLTSMTEIEVQAKFDADELNENGIYPNQWNNDDSLDVAFGKRQIIQDFKELKAVITKADQEQDYIFVYVG
jgi:hypothetical protein